MDTHQILYDNALNEMTQRLKHNDLTLPALLSELIGDAAAKGDYQPMRDVLALIDRHQQTDETAPDTHQFAQSLMEKTPEELWRLVAVGLTTDELLKLTGHAKSDEERKEIKKEGEH
jgi:hypothetical protein